MLMQVATPRAKKLYAENGECDFSFQAGEVARFRVNAYRQRQKLCLAVRYISTQIPTLQDLRLPVATMKKIADNSRGLVLVTGITGSGKSSTLAAVVDYINDTRAEHILTIEDPIEFVHRDKKAIITQREIGEDTHTYAEGLKMAMRQDPDVILIGEMRDLETTSAAITAALTGHLVFATLHTIDAVQTIARIVDLYPTHQQALVRIQLAESLRAIVSQRLLPSTKGGRVPAVEILINTPHVRKQIEDNKSGEILAALAKGQFYGMMTFNQSLVKLFKDGLASEAEVLAAASSPDDLKLALRGIEQELKPT
jgi:twitching motility protein PilT